MDLSGNELLAGSALPRDEHHPFRARYPADQAIQLQHRLARAEKRAEFALLLGDPTQCRYFAPQIAVFEPPEQGHQEATDIERFDDEVVSPRLNRGHGGFDATKCRNDDHDELWSQLFYLLGEGDAALTGHADVGDQRVELARVESCAYLGGRSRPSHL
jgi:hypothetical protein